MKRPYFRSYVLCAIVAICASPVLAGSIIDESFDSGVGVTESMGMGMHVADIAMADTWFSLAQGFPVWTAGMGEAMIDSTMAPMDAYTTLVYFSAKPAGGWSGNGEPLELSFRYRATADDLLKFGVYGWSSGAEIPAGPNPGSDGVLLMEGDLLAAPAFSPIADSYAGGALSRFDFIGATFTMAGSPNDIGSAGVDDVKLAVVPEPASMVLAVMGFVALAVMRRRRRPGKT